MTAFLIVLAVAAEAYLLGSVDTGILVSKYLYHDDVRTHGSGAAGMTNMLRTFGKKAAALTAVGDVLKGVVAVCLGRWLFGHLPAVCAVELVPVVFGRVVAGRDDHPGDATFFQDGVGQLRHAVQRGIEKRLDAERREQARGVAREQLAVLPGIIGDGDAAARLPRLL